MRPVVQTRDNFRKQDIVVGPMDLMRARHPARYPAIFLRAAGSRLCPAMMGCDVAIVRDGPILRHRRIFRWVARLTHGPWRSQVEQRRLWHLRVSEGR